MDGLVHATNPDLNGCKWPLIEVGPSGCCPVGLVSKVLVTQIPGILPKGLSLGVLFWRKRDSCPNHSFDERPALKEELVVIRACKELDVEDKAISRMR